MTKEIINVLNRANATAIELEVWAFGGMMTITCADVQDAIETASMYEGWGGSVEVSGWIDNNPFYLD